MNRDRLGINFKENEFSTDDLYFALIGRIEAEPVSQDVYINNGEYMSHYTAVKKCGRKYYDVFDDVEYEFRNENENETILTLHSFSTENNIIENDYLKNFLEFLNLDLGDNRLKKDTDKQYARTRK